ncbi:hypothetical protein CO038_01440 [Candidatus Pacearchaeota archaeon CG_4_9_14_0_2_um_filter_39_13]|nr:ABC transporter ATP-binding protein [Candidatus Pacearchaeota archaeon]OIO43777.1 MAG: hypothetical protein AUJ64_01695 [Candidatus Pacearchaeota archaeon CG1_02_39_14]PJC44872.1 MAG: hypothetical protein CO038_01440 [Candidatus Pacearchaeota archaeon CG_4_9_14_0_2_um_filter_39_13]
MVKIRKAEKINFRYNLKVYWEIARKYKGTMFFAVLLVLVSSTTHVADKFIFKVVVDRGTDFINSGLTKEAFIGILVSLTWAYIGIILIRSVSTWHRIDAVNRLDSSLIIDLKRKFFNHVLHLSHKFHTTHKTGSLIARMTRGANAIEKMTDFMVFNTFPLIFQFILVGASLFYFDIATGFVVSGIAIVFIGYSLWIQEAQKKSSIAYNNSEDLEKANISDIFTNIDSIKYFGKERAITRKYDSLSDRTRRKALWNWGYYRWFDSGQTFILAIGTLLLIMFPILRLLQGEISIGTIVFIYTSYSTLFGPLYGLVHGMKGFYLSMADFESLFQYIKVENEIKDKQGAEEIRIRRGEVEFKNVSFNYGKRGLLKDFNLKIKSGEKVALVGHSGSGKTTIVKLLYRLYDVDSGNIRIDDKDIRDFKQESLRGELSVVPQEAILFDDTIYNNIAFSNPRASKEEVRAAIRFAQLDRMIKDFPKGENTIVGERGVKLSGGEKQRVSIARAILANKKILVLDEATSSLDSKTEYEIQKDLEKLMQGRTSIIIAHRLSTVMKADKIIVMEKGRIVQAGKHKDLIKQKGTYRELWNLQKGGYIE